MRLSIVIMAFELSNVYFYMILFLLPFSTSAQTYSNISLGSSLTAMNENSYWASQSTEFAFGFQKIGEDYLLAIWFDNIPEKTIVWSANRDNLVQRGSKVQLTSGGRLLLNDQNGKEVWSSDNTGMGIAYAAMLDTGNFVLASQDGVNLWQSFDKPTDTILPTQNLNPDMSLIASFSARNYSSGRFQFKMQTDGNLLLYSRNFPFDSLNSPYWSTQTSGTNFRVIFNQSGFIYLAAGNGSILSMLSSNTAPTQEFHHRAVLEYDGVFRQYIYPKTANSSSGTWPMSWSTVFFLPSDICLEPGVQVGGGACGFNRYCRLGDDDKHECLCPPNYTLLDPNDEMKGCRQNFIPQNCGTEMEEKDLFVFEEMINTDWPFSDYEHFQIVPESWCRQACMSDCLCAVAIFREGNCWKKRLPLSNGRVDPSIGGKALLKIRKNNSSSGSESKRKDQSTVILIGSVLLGSSFVLNLLLPIATLLVVFHFKKRNSKVQTNQVMTSMMNLQSFSYKELEKATENFKEELGCGAFGRVYKGVLPFENDILVAVKKLDKLVSEGEQEFKTEVMTISQTNHKNLVHLLGSCNEGQHRLLVYEYMKNGSLSDFLFGNSRPNWFKRMQIAFGTARGLLYLHEECSTQIIHCDIKPQNILLDDSLMAKISDFGLAKLLKKDQTRTTTAIRGTKGYVAPEWFRNMPITVKVDVYSFGVLLLELICCRRSFEIEAKDENETILTDWAYDCYKEGKLYRLVQNDEHAMDDMKRVEKFVIIAIWCIQEDPSLRPNMRKVMQMLEGTAEAPVPPDPSSYLSSISTL